MVMASIVASRLAGQGWPFWQRGTHAWPSASALAVVLATGIWQQPVGARSVIKAPVTSAL